MFRLGGPTIAREMLLPLFLMAFGFTFYFMTVLILRMRAEIAERKLRFLRLGALQRAAGAERLAQLS